MKTNLLSLSAIALLTITFTHAADDQTMTRLPSDSATTSGSSESIHPEESSLARNAVRSELPDELKLFVRTNSNDEIFLELDSEDFRTHFDAISKTTFPFIIKTRQTSDTPESEAGAEVPRLPSTQAFSSPEPTQQTQTE